MRGSQAIISFGEIPVERCDDGVLAAGIIDMTGPLPDTGSAGIGQHYPADLVEGSEVAILFYGKPHQLGAGGNGKFTSCFQAFGLRLGGYRGRTADILVRRIGTGADERYFYLVGP